MNPSFKDFTNDDLERIMKIYPETQYNHKEIEEYINSLDAIHKKALEIANDHLQTSFHLVRSNGFKEWKKKKEENV